MVDFGFERITTNRFENDVVRLVMDFEPRDSVAPDISVWFKSEPKYTTIDFSWFVNDEIDYDRLWKSKSYEANVAFYAKLLQSHINQLVGYDISFLLKGMKNVFVNMIKSEGLTKDNYLLNMSSEPRKFYSYIKKKKPKWNPARDL